MVLKRCDRVITIFFVDDEEYFDETVCTTHGIKDGFFLVAIVQQEPGDTAGGETAVVGRRLVGLYIQSHEFLETRLATRDAGFASEEEQHCPADLG